jgi:Peptidase family M1 domain
MKKSAFILCLFAFRSSAYSQQKQYFQQEVNYTITVRLDDAKNDLHADESIEYSNNSPDELDFVWFHIWPNAYKNNHTPLGKQLVADGNLKFYFASDEERGNISGLDFKVNGQTVKTEPGASIDIIKLVLNQPIKPGEKIKITTPFNVHIPLGIFSRLGHIGQQYQITQWFPKPAVYDKYGWHNIPYLNQGEFYSEFGSFDVSITIPRNYVVGATGTLVNGEEETAWLMKNAEATKAIDKFNPGDNEFPVSSSEMKTLRYQAASVHDFAWFADKRYHVLHDEVELPRSKKKVDTWVMFTNQYGNYWKKSAKYVNDAVYYYSLWNGDYPYPHATAVDGALSAGGGMEYPMITVIGKAGSDSELDRVIAHEVGHNWFYGILGSNERDHAWMDEGINSFNENRYMKKKYPKDSVQNPLQVRGIPIGKILGIPNLDESTLFDLAYRFNAVRKLDQPVDLTSAEYTQVNYGSVVYGKTAIILGYLQAYLGEEMYDKCAQAYFEAWKFHHPYPPDIKKVYEQVSGKDLSWFFDEIIPTIKQIDYKICSAEKRSDGNMEVKVRNKGEISSPFSISPMKNGKAISTTWFDGFEGTKKMSISVNDFDQLKIDDQNSMPDINRQNSTLKSHGLCKKTEPFNLKMFGIVHNTDKTQLFWSPVLGWNNYNKFMLGAAIYNNLLPEKKFEYVLMPMYGFGNKDLAGGASIQYNIHPNAIFQSVGIGMNADRYCYVNEKNYNTNKTVGLNFNKIAPFVSFEIKKRHLISPVKQIITLREINVLQEYGLLYHISPPNVYEYDYRTISSTVNEFNYLLDNGRKINPFNVGLNVQQWNSTGDNYLKGSLTANYNITLKKKGKSIDTRFFVGKSFNDAAYPRTNFYLHASGGTGFQDYLYDNIFLGRYEASGFLSHQFTETDGGMKVYTPLGITDNWLAAANLKSSLPGKIPFKLFADFSSYQEYDRVSHTDIGEIHFLYDAGIYIPLVKNIVEVYFPILVSKNIKHVFYLNNSDLVDLSHLNDTDPQPLKRMLRMIRFTFNIKKLNPFELVRNLSL